MTPETFVALIEEMIDLKVQQHMEAHVKTSQEVSRVLHHKREADRQRLRQIKDELVKLLSR
jgi:hypothetical protein